MSAAARALLWGVKMHSAVLSQQMSGVWITSDMLVCGHIAVAMMNVVVVNCCSAGGSRLLWGRALSDLRRSCYSVLCCVAQYSNDELEKVLYVE